MIKLIQILTYMKNKGMGLDQIMDELTEIVDNHRSELFVLTETDCMRITEVFEDDNKFEAALAVVGVL